MTYGQHLVSLIEDEELHLVGLQGTTLDHVVDTAGGTDNNLRTLTESVHVLTDTGTTDTGMAGDVLHEVTDGDDDLLDLLGQLTGRSDNQGLASLEVGVDLLEGGDGEGSGLSGTGLSLGNDIVACTAEPLVSTLAHSHSVSE